MWQPALATSNPLVNSNHLATDRQPATMWQPTANQQLCGNPLATSTHLATYWQPATIWQPTGNQPSQSIVLIASSIR